MNAISRAAIMFFVFEMILPRQAAAYVDPGTTGLLSQILYVLFYGALGVFFYFLRCIKENVTNTKQFMAKLFGGKPSIDIPSE